jgi:hypothetical protein
MYLEGSNFIINLQWVVFFLKMPTVKRTKSYQKKRITVAPFIEILNNRLAIVLLANEKLHITLVTALEHSF